MLCLEEFCSVFEIYKFVYVIILDNVFNDSGLEFVIKDDSNFLVDCKIIFFYLFLKGIIFKWICVKCDNFLNDSIIVFKFVNFDYDNNKI